MSIPWQPLPSPALCQKFPCSSEVIQLAERYPKASDFVTALHDQHMSPEAVQSLAHFLPKEKAVEWAAQSARLAGESTGISTVEQNALAAAEAWVADPSAANQQAAALAAAELPATSPAGWTAQAAAFAEGVEVPEAADAVDMGNDLTAQFTSGAVQLAAAKTAPAGLPDLPAVPEVPAITIPNALENPLSTPSVVIPAAPPLESLTPSQLAETAKYLDPFLKLGMALAKTLPGWL